MKQERKSGTKAKWKFSGMVAKGAAVSAMAVLAFGVSTVSAHTAGSTTTHYPLYVKDQAGHAVKITKQPLRIASGTEGTDEMLTALVPKKDIVLVTSVASDPTQSDVTAQVKGIPQMQTANAEQIVKVHPDLVFLASYTKQGVVSQVEQANIPVYEFQDFNSIKEIEHNILEVGTLVNRKAKAETLVGSMVKEIRTIHKAVALEKKVTVLEDSSYGYVAGNGTTVNDVIRDAGGINAAAKVNGWGAITDEQIVAMNPDVILVSSDDAAFQKKLLADSQLQSVPAIANHRVYVVKSADLMSVSQNIVKGVADVAHVLYPNVKLPK